MDHSDFGNPLAFQLAPPMRPATFGVLSEMCQLLDGLPRNILQQFAKEIMLTC